jgi:hypothetical protein
MDSPTPSWTTANLTEPVGKEFDTELKGRRTPSFLEKRLNREKVS